jgi:hypothetical protein
MTRNGETHQDRTRTTAVCGCPIQTIPGNKFEALFHGLDHLEDYFPLVSRFEDRAFFGRPPASARPIKVEMSVPKSSTPTPSLDLERLSTPAGDSDEDMESLEDATNDVGKDTSSTEPASTPALSVEVPPSALGRRNAREATIPHRHRFERSGEAEDLVARGHLNQDELDWKVWHAEELPIQFAKLRPNRVQAQVSFAHLGRHRAMEIHKLTKIATWSDPSYCRMSTSKLHLREG